MIGRVFCPDRISVLATVLLSVTLGALVLSACGTGSELTPALSSSPTARATLTPSPVPTDNPTPVPTATAAPASTPVPQTPPGDCWGGALPEDGVHCYVFEQSQMEGTIKVVAIYEAPNDVLHIFLARTDPLDQTLSALFREKAAAFLDVGVNELDSLAFFFERPPGRDPRRELVPPSMEGYGQAFLHVGGLKAVQTQPGWASWTRLWPEEPGESLRRDPGSSRTFDVSGIDTGNIPKPDCDAIGTGSACNLWKRYPESGVAGYDVESNRRESTISAYIQIKENLLPPGEEEQESLTQRLLHEDSLLRIDEITLIPVKYDYWELWTWATILNRFVLSSANTIGIVWARVETNLPYFQEQFLPLDGWTFASYQDKSTVRETVGIGVQEAEVVLEALPELLPLLGIPVDAVGVVTVIEDKYIEFDR